MATSRAVVYPNEPVPPMNMASPNNATSLNNTGNGVIGETARNRASPARTKKVLELTMQANDVEKSSPKRPSKRAKSRSKSGGSTGFIGWVGLLLLLMLGALVAVVVFFVTRSIYQTDVAGEQQLTGCDDFSFYDDAALAEGEEEDSSEVEYSAEDLRLPTALSPNWYNWTVKTYFPYGDLWYDEEKNFTIEGSLEINFQCVEETDRITLNQNGLNISEKSFEIWHSDTIMLDYFYLDSMEVDNDRQMVTFFLNGSCVLTHNYTMAIQYTGPINQHVLTGLYSSSYRAPDGKTRYLVTTQMEPIDARRALPLFDEPSMKAVFQVAIIHPVGTVALSNAMENASYAIGGGWALTDYIPSPKMSSYLLAVVICDFEYTEAIVNDVRFRIYARPEVKNQTTYAAEIGPKVLTHYEEYFGIKFPLEKLDMIALPDFQAGAMENWGLITYREKYLLYDPSVYTLENKQIVAVVIAHELAHMWFGNLVTMEWWDDLWLNEGFATFVEYIGAHHADPGFEMYKQFVSQSVLGSMLLDHLATSHPLYVPIEKVSQIEEVFDAISYEKGGSIIRMLEYVLGKRTFNRGLNYYLKTYAYSNANNTELWESFSYMAEGQSEHPNWDGGDLNVTEFARSWTVQMGFPLLDVERKVGNLVTITQNRFKLDPNAEEAERYQEPEYGYEWYIPIWYRTAEARPEAKPYFQWLTPDHSPKKTLTNLEAKDWILVNPGARAYYRVRYDQKNYDLLSAALKTNYPPFSVESRSQLLDDVFVLAKSDRLVYTTALQMTTYLNYEDNVLPWQIAMANLEEIASLIRYTPAFGNMRTYLVELLLPKYDFLSWKQQPADNVLEEKMEGFVVEKMCRLDHFACYSYAVQQFNDNVLSGCRGRELSGSCNSLRPIFRATVYCMAVKHGPPTNWDLFWQWFQTEQNQVERQRIIRALGCSDEVWRLNWLLNETLYTDVVRRQDVVYIFIYVSREPAGANIMWKFFTENWDTIYEKFKEANSFMKYIIKSAFARVQSNYTIHEVEVFRRRHAKTTRTFKAFDIELEKSRAREKWMALHYEEMKQWFTDEVKIIEEQRRLQ